MKIKDILSKKRVVFLLIFLVLVFVGKRINFSSVVGMDNQFFTLFQFFGPIAGSFLGTVFGLSVVLGSQILDILINGNHFTLITILRLTPMLFAVYYFSTKNKSTFIVPLLAMFLFIAHPIGKTVWFYTLYWLIPIIVKLLPKKYSNMLFLKSLGSTFTAHSIGSVIWIWTIPMTAEQWILLIPVVAIERFLFSIGISGSYITFNTVLDWLISKFRLKTSFGVINIDKRYIITNMIKRSE